MQSAIQRDMESSDDKTVETFRHNCRLMTKQQLIEASNTYFNLWKKSKDDYWYRLVTVAESFLNKE